MAQEVRNRHDRMGYPLVAVEKAEVEPAEECERNEGYERGCSERASHQGKQRAHGPV